MAKVGARTSGMPTAPVVRPRAYCSNWMPGPEFLNQVQDRLVQGGRHDLVGGAVVVRATIRVMAPKYLPSPFRNGPDLVPGPESSRFRNRPGAAEVEGNAAEHARRLRIPASAPAEGHPGSRSPGPPARSRRPPRPTSSSLGRCLPPLAGGPCPSPGCRAG